MSFFDRSEADWDDDADLESDLDRALDECVGANLTLYFLVAL